MKAFQLSQIESRPFDREKGNSVTHAVSWGRGRCPSSKSMTYYLEEKTDKDCAFERLRGIASAWQDEHFEINIISGGWTACGVLAKIHS